MLLIPFWLRLLFPFHHANRLLLLLLSHIPSLAIVVNPRQQLHQQPITWEFLDDDYSNVKLRKLSLSDVDDLIEWHADEKASKFLESFTSKSEAKEYITGRHQYHRAICLKNKAIGCISVRPFWDTEKRCRCEIGYVLASKYWGKGIATKAVKMVVFTIFSEFPQVERIEAMADVENMGSQRVLEKAGFRKEGVLRKYVVVHGEPRDMVMYSLLSTDPQVHYFLW
ncbi:hypothetical protein ACH5RR_031324 [Cinchona calisaya]|uniref:N-acetyltransferase domain-containing protein n=1 Tax=Cinchona calisaya TaxID=153742 RepID=A0ABD2YHX1_9GENT